MAYDGAHWVHDEKTPLALAEATSRRIAAQAARHEDPRHAGSLVARILKRDAIKALPDLGSHRLAMRIAAFDADPWLFNVANGTLDLRTGTLRAPDPKDWITKLSPVAYDPHATCPRWLAHLEKVVPSAAVRDYLQRLAGYWLTGVIREHVLPIQWGDGGNGKGVTFNTLLYIWGDYGAAVPAELLLARGDHDEHPTERAQLLGLRLAVASETERNRRMNEALVKQLTGGDPLKARFMRQDYFQFLPTHKLALLTNYKPVVSGTDRGIWRRLRLMPWLVNIPEAEQDTKLEQRLRDESPGILAWAVRGCLAWQRDGLCTPDEVLEATQRFRDDSNVIGRFLAERCIRASDARVGATQLYTAFKAWCSEAGERVMSQKIFGSDLVSRHNVPPSTEIGGRLWYRGVGLRSFEIDPERDGDHRENGRHDEIEVNPNYCGDHGDHGDHYPRSLSHEGHIKNKPRPRSPSPPWSPDKNGRFVCPRGHDPPRPECGHCGPAFPVE